VVPSRWAKTIVDGYLEGQVATVWQHGVDVGFAVDPEFTQHLIDSYERGHFVVSHYSSSAFERKGTVELVEAWSNFCKLGLVMNPTLRLILDCDVPKVRRAVERMCASKTVEFVGRLGYGPHEMSCDYQLSHVVCQPSRGEAFGMIPLEARRCGVPIVITSRTGHSEHVFMPGTSTLEPGQVIVEMGADASIDDGPGALAPSLDQADICDSMVRVWNRWRTVKEGSVLAASAVGQAWSWEATAERWLKEIET
jgi:glycosyltransferase involved in cell wall biosynthesis